MTNHKPYILLFILLILQACDTAFETDLAGKKVILLAPADHLTTTDSTHAFYWETLKGAAQYRLQVVSPGFDFIARLIEDTTVSADRFTISDMDKGSYQWRVRAVNNSSISDTSATWNLTIH